MFDIRDYADRFLVFIKRHGSSSAEYECPVCGEPGFKINLTTGAYKGWRCHCTNKQIREQISSMSGEHIPTVRSQVFQTFVDPFPWQSPHTLFEVSDTKLPLTYLSNDKKCKYTHYLYSDTQKVVRIDTEDRKYIVPMTKVGGIWEKCKLQQFPPYKISTWHVAGPNPTCIGVEGEKVVAHLAKFDIPVFTLSGSDWGEVGMLMFKLWLVRSHVANVIFCPDWDIPGRDKASKIRDACWSVGVGYREVTIPTLMQFDPSFELKEGADIADLNVEKPNLLEIFNQ